MRCALATLGSRGDIEPFVQLGAALAARHHTVTLAVDDGYRALPSLLHERIDVVSLGTLALDDMVAAVRGAVGAATPDARSGSGYRRFIGHRRGELGDRLVALAGAHDLLIIGDSLALLESGRFPWATPTAIVFYTLGPDSEYRRLSTVAGRRLVALPARLAPRDASLRASLTFTGFWRRLDAARLPSAVETFLAEGAPPLFLTMGSMAGFDQSGLAARFVAAARAHGHRVVLQRGWADLAVPAASDVLIIDEVDYAALFPRCAALFMHGGAGTIGQGLLAARPIGVLPLVEDQVAWARTLTSWGTSLGTIDPRAADRAAFDGALRRIGDGAITTAAARIADELQREGGLQAACDALEQ